MLKKIISSSFIYFLISTSIAIAKYEKADAFIVKAYDNRIKVLSPPKYYSGIHVIIENKTLSKFLAQILTRDGKTIGFVSIAPGKFQSIQLNEKSDRDILLIPLSPGFQEIELLAGKKSYEIPPKK